MSLILQQCTTCLVCFALRVCEMGHKWLYRCCFVGVLFKTARSIFVQFLSSFFSMFFVSVQVVHSYSSTDMATDWKKFCFILSERSDFHMIDNLSKAVHAFAMHNLTLISVDEILLPRYVNWSTNFRGFPQKILSCLKHINSLLCVFKLSPIPPVVCSRLCSRSICEKY